MSSVGAEENNVTVLPHVVLRQKKSSSLNKVQKLKRRISDSLGRLSSFSSRKSKAHNHDLNTDDHQWHNADDLATPDSDANFLQSWERLHLSEGDGLDRKGSVTRAMSVASDSRLLDIQSSHDNSFKVSSPRDGTPESFTPGKSSNKSRDGATKSGGDSGFGSGTGSLADLLSSVVRRSKKSRVPRPFSEACLAPIQPPSLLQTTDEPLERKERRRSKRYSAYGIDSVYGREDAYVRLEQLGEGSYATVFKGISNLTGQEVALKEIRLQEEEGAPFTAIREASLLRDLRHSNIVTLHDIVHTKTSLTLVFEYVAGDLAQYLERHPGGLVANNVRLLLFQLLRGLAYCHHRKILHRDLKPQNLLLSLSGELKLADFGLARAQSVPSHTYSPEVVTLWYRPPDVLLGTTNYTATLDIWGAGCVFVETLTGHPAFPGAKDSFDQLDKIFQVLGTPTEATWHGISQLPNYKPAKLAFHRAHRLGRAFPRLYDVAHAEALAIKLLQLRPESRPSAREAMRHEFFSSLPPEVFSLSDLCSIFTVPGIQWSTEARHHPPAVLRVAQDLRRQR